MQPSGWSSPFLVLSQLGSTIPTRHLRRRKRSQPTACELGLAAARPSLPLSDMMIIARSPAADPYELHLEARESHHPPSQALSPSNGTNRTPLPPYLAITLSRRPVPKNDGRQWMLVTSWQALPHPSPCPILGYRFSTSGRRANSPTLALSRKFSCNGTIPVPTSPLDCICYYI
jgi:hypothetical protein